MGRTQYSGKLAGCLPASTYPVETASCGYSGWSMKPVSRGVVVLLGLVLVAVAAVCAMQAYQAWQMLHRPPAVRAEDTSRIRAWMSVRLIATAHQVSAVDLAARLGAPADGNTTLLDLARRQGVPVAEMENRARQAVADLQTSSPGPGPPPTGRAG